MDHVDDLAIERVNSAAVLQPYNNVLVEAKNGSKGRGRALSRSKIDSRIPVALQATAESGQGNVRSDYSGD